LTYKQILPVYHN